MAENPDVKLHKQRSQRFTPQEDELLRSLVKDKKTKTWKEIAEMLPGRSATQCRDRYNQYLCKEVVAKPWTVEEDQIILEKYKILGPKWTQISQFLPGRSGNNVKNRWNCSLYKHNESPNPFQKLHRQLSEKHIEITTTIVSMPIAQPAQQSNILTIEKPDIQENSNDLTSFAVRNITKPIFLDFDLCSNCKKILI